MSIPDDEPQPRFANREQMKDRIEDLENEVTRIKEYNEYYDSVLFNREYGSEIQQEAFKKR